MASLSVCRLELVALDGNFVKFLFNNILVQRQQCLMFDHPSCNICNIGIIVLFKNKYFAGYTRTLYIIVDHLRMQLEVFL